MQDIIANILVKNVTMVSAQNGARIKAFGGSASSTSTTGGGSGYVRNITFVDFAVRDVDLPIVIDQCYQTAAATCASFPSKVAISDVHYVNVTGTGSKSKEVVSMMCSDVCGNITAQGTRLVGTSGSSQYFCTNIASTADLDFPCSAAGAVVSGTGVATKSVKSTSTVSKAKSTTTTTKTSKAGARKARATV